jgi:hypothetical protein
VPPPAGLECAEHLAQCTRLHDAVVVLAQEGERTVADHHSLALGARLLHAYGQVSERLRHVAGEGVARLVVVLVGVDQREGQRAAHQYFSLSFCL